MCDIVLDRGHRLLFILGSLTPAFLHKVANLMGLQFLVKKKIKGHIYIFPLYLHKSNVVASVGCLCDGTKRETIHSQFPYLIIRERAEHLCVTCFGIVAFLASGTACGAVRLTWICGRGKMPQADRNWKQDYIQAEPNKWCIIFRNIEILNRALSWAADWLHMVFSDVGS